MSSFSITKNLLQDLLFKLDWMTRINWHIFVINAKNLVWMIQCSLNLREAQSLIRNWKKICHLLISMVFSEIFTKITFSFHMKCIGVWANIIRIIIKIGCLINKMSNYSNNWLKLIKLNKSLIEKKTKKLASWNQVWNEITKKNLKSKLYLK